MLDREYIRQIINEGETLTFDFFGEYCNIEIVTKKYKSELPAFFSLNVLKAI